MGILIKKLQQGGAVYGDSKFIRLNADIPMQMPSGGQRGPQMVNGPSTSGKAKEEDSLKGYLPSDIDYHNQKKRALQEKINAGYASNKQFDTTPEYASIMEAIYILDTQEAEKMKAMHDVYIKASTEFNSDKRQAGDAPAILNGKAVVSTIAQGKLVDFKLIGVDELLKNADKYRLWNGSDIVKFRFDRPEFSGFTDLGKTADQIISNAYGSKTFNETIDDKLKNANYIKSGGGYKHTITNQILDFNDYKFNEGAGIVETTKTNVPQLISIYDAFQQEDETNLSNYLYGKAVQNLYNKINSKAIELAPDAGKEELDTLISKSIEAQLLSKMKTGVLIDEEAKKATDSTGGGGEGKDIKTHVLRLGYFQMLQGKDDLEIPGVPKEDKENMVFKVNNAVIDDGIEYLKSGYNEKETVLNDSDDKNIEPSRNNRRTLNNNNTVNNMLGDNGEITLYDGSLLTDYTEDNDLTQAVIANSGKMHVLLAPIETDNKGNRRVNFKHKYITEYKKAVDETYKRLAEEKIKPEEIIKGNQTVINRATEIANEELAKIGKGKDLTIGVAYSFDVLYESTYERMGTNEGGIDLSGSEVSELYNAIDDTTFIGFGDDNAKKTKVFVPVSPSFWTRSLAYDGVPDKFRVNYSKNDYEGAMKSKAANNAFNMDFIPTIKKQGGKLMDNDELTKLLFNY